MLLKEFASAIRALACKFGNSLTKDDLIQEGQIALWRAAIKFDSARGAQFKTFALKCVRNQMFNFLRKKSTDLEKTFDFVANAEDAPLEEIPLIEKMPCPKASEAFKQAEERIDSELLEPQIAIAIDKSPERQQKALLMRY